MAEAGADRLGAPVAAGFAPLGLVFAAGTMSHVINVLILLSKILTFESCAVA
jgi:hypothetical protein